ncbi:MAG: putative transposase [Lysobacterales bacterium]|jgi:putative transposase
MNLLHNIKKQKNKKIILKSSKKIFKAKTKLQALRLANKFKKCCIKEEPKAIKKKFKDFDQCLTYFNFPTQQHAWIKTSNHIELYFKQIRRRIRPIGCFKNKSSDDRYILD